MILTRFIQLFPWLKHVAPEATGYRAMNDAMMGIRVLAEDLVKEHKKEVVSTYSGARPEE